MVAVSWYVVVVNGGAPGGDMIGHAAAGRFDYRSQPDTNTEPLRTRITWEGEVLPVWAHPVPGNALGHPRGALLTTAEYRRLSEPDARQE